MKNKFKYIILFAALITLQIPLFHIYFGALYFQRRIPIKDICKFLSNQQDDS